MHRVERALKLRARPTLYAAAALSLLALMLLPTAARAQWTQPDASNNIHSTNSGNVGVGTGTNAPASRLEVFNPTGGSSSVNYFQVTGATADNSNYPGLQLKGGTLATEFPQFKLSNGGLAASLIGGRSATYANRMGLSLSSNSATNAYASVQRFDGTTTADLFVVRDSGNVGIGTLTPGYRLHIAGDNTSTGGYPIIKMENTQAGGHSWWFYAGALGVPGAFGIYDETAQKYRLFFDPSGNVGMGTSAPTRLLSVSGASNPQISINNPSVAYTANQRAAFGANDGEAGTLGLSNNSTGGLWLKSFNNAAPTGIGGYISSYSENDLTTWADLTFNVAKHNGGGGFTSHAGMARRYAFQQNGGDLLTILGSGNVVVGSVANPTHKLEVGGDVNASGAINATGAITGATINATYQDVAEWVPSTQKLSAGTVVVLDTNKTNHVLASTKPYDTGVAGVVSETPGLILGQGSAEKLKVATTGRVKVRVDATIAPIKVGDLLVTSGVEGVAMKSTPVDLGGVQIHRPGTIIGKALEPLDKGTGEILVLLSLQ
jgi:Peptidase_G2, IMC autoproteolytic cleavage domain